MKTEIIYKNGNPYFSLDGSEYVPAAFRSFRPTPANVSLFNRADVKLYQFLISGQITGMDIPYSLYPPVWLDESEYDFEALDLHIDLFRRFAPDGKLWVFFQLDTPRAWVERDKTIADSFWHLETAFFDERWKTAAAEYARRLITYCEEKYGDLIFAYAFTAGRSCEWFTNAGMILETPEKLAAWREYVGDANASLPSIRDIKSYTPDEITRDADGMLRAEASSAVKYLRFLTQASSDTVCRFAREIQKTLGHKKPIGTFYGYSIDFPINAPTDAPSVFACPDIDIIFSPAAYDRFRHLDGAASWQLAVNSLALHDKLYLHEIDHRTPLARYPLEAPTVTKHMGYRLNKYRLMNDCIDTEEETVEILRRELAATLSVGGSLWWFDFFGGYYATPTLEGEIKREVAIMERFRECKYTRESVAEILVLHDPSSKALIREMCKSCHDFIKGSLYEIEKLGAPYDIYNLNDLPTIDTSRYKLCIFLDMFRYNPETARLISEKLQHADKLWIYASGYVGEGFSTDTMRSLIGIDVERFSASELMPITAHGEKYAFSAVTSPLFRVTDKDASPLGYYADNTVATAKKGRNIYSSAPQIPASVLYRLAKDAGVHMYTDSAGGALKVSTQMISYQTTLCEDITLHMTCDGVYEELFGNKIYKTDNKKLSYHAKIGETKLFIKIG